MLCKRVGSANLAGRQRLCLTGQGNGALQPSVVVREHGLLRSQTAVIGVVGCEMSSAVLLGQPGGTGFGRRSTRRDDRTYVQCRWPATLIQASRKARKYFVDRRRVVEAAVMTGRTGAVKQSVCA